jgi:thiol peroxidase
MTERTGVVTSRGRPLTLLGNEVKIGDKAPDFEVQANDTSLFRFSSVRGKICILSAVPSLDTSTCDRETRRFNQEAANLDPDVAILTISMDLPFAQKRWCTAAGVTRLQTLSDHRDASFGINYGTLVKESRLLTRAVFVVDRAGIVRYVEYVKDSSNEPDYPAVMDTVKKLAS